MRGALWLEMGQSEHQESNTCAGLKHMKYLKIQEIIMIYFFKRPHWLSLEGARGTNTLL